MSGGSYVGDPFGLIKNDLSGRPEICDEQQQSAYSVEKLEKNGGLFFCRKPKHSDLRTALVM
jgi:hypothetical protein